MEERIAARILSIHPGRMPHIICPDCGHHTPLPYSWIESNHSSTFTLKLVKKNSNRDRRCNDCQVSSATVPLAGPSVNLQSVPLIGQYSMAVAMALQTLSCPAGARRWAGSRGRAGLTCCWYGGQCCGLCGAALPGAGPGKLSAGAAAPPPSAAAAAAPQPSREHGGITWQTRER